MEALRAQDLEKLQLMPPAIQVVPKEKVSKIKTYTRKTERKPYFKDKKRPIIVSRSDSVQNSSPQQQQLESNYLKFVPPHLNTLVGARSLMANIPRLQQLSMVTKVELISKPAPTNIFKLFPTNI